MNEDEKIRVTQILKLLKYTNRLPTFCHFCLFLNKSTKNKLNDYDNIYILPMDIINRYKQY